MPLLDKEILIGTERIIKDNFDIDATESYDELIEKYENNKKEIYSLFGNKLIVSSDIIETNISEDDIVGLYYEFFNKIDAILVGTVKNAEICRKLITENRVDGFKNNKIVYDIEIENIKFPKGMKMSKAFRLIISDKEKLSKIQNLYSSYIQRCIVGKKGRLYLSIHPYDYLSISDNNHGWDSCHTLVDGDYKAGNLNYMIDKYTVVAYFLSENDSFNHSLEPFEQTKWNSKLWRCLIHLRIDEDKGAIIYNKRYPYESRYLIEQLDNLLISLIPMKFEKLMLYNDLMKQLDFKLIDNSKNTCQYLDIYQQSNSCNALARITSTIRDCLETFIYVGEPFHCFSCGLEYASETKFGLCMNCGDVYDECNECGCTIDKEESIYIERYGYHICPDCLDELYSFCPVCEDYEYSKSFKRLEGLNRAWCFSCIEKRKSNPLNVLILSNFQNDEILDKIETTKLKKLESKILTKINAFKANTNALIIFLNNRENTSIRGKFYSSMADISIEGSIASSAYLKDIITNQIKSFPEIETIEIMGLNTSKDILNCALECKKLNSEIEVSVDTRCVFDFDLKAQEEAFEILDENEIEILNWEE